MSLKVIHAVTQHQRRRHGQQPIGVPGLSGKDVEEQCTSEYCGVCLCDYIRGWR